jgi:hypothetical protein
MGNRATNQEDRDAASARVKQVKVDYDETKAARDARSKWLLENDAEYQRLKGETQAKREEFEVVQGAQFYYRLTVGTNEGWAFMVKAQGDNWADVIRKLEQAQAKQVEVRKTQAERKRA